jgi:hypothetical protein
MDEVTEQKAYLYKTESSYLSHVVDRTGSVHNKMKLCL